MNTKDELKKIINNVDEKTLGEIDEDIRRFVSKLENDVFSQTVEYIKKRIEKYCKYSKKRLKTKCEILAKKYIGNENAWMTQENIFCLLALVYTSLSLMLRVVQEITNYTPFVSDAIQVFLLVGALIFFGVLCNNGKIYDNKDFIGFLKEFNRIAPSITILMTLLFYLGLVSIPKEWGSIKNVILFACAILMLMPIILALKRTYKFRKNHIQVVAKVGDKFKKLVIFIKKGYRYIKEKRVFKKIYEVVSVISTLMIFAGLVYFVVGKITNNNQSDNDLIMRQIKEEISENQQITNIEVDDIHGFGNNSIIVTTANNTWGGERDGNRLIILESVENEILNSMNDLLGLKSNYKMTFSNGLTAENMVLYPEINCVLDILGGSTKEILVDYYVYRSTYGAYYTAIYRYSYEAETYELIGSYPIVSSHDVSKYDEEGNITSTWSQDVDSKFDVLSCEDKEVYKFNDYENTFNLTCYSSYCRDYWAEFSNMGKVMVVVKRDKWEKEALINVYYVTYDEEGKVIWRVIYSENTTDLSENYTKDELAKWMENRFDCRVNMY